MIDPKSCERCGQPHERCAGHNRAGNPCGLWPKAGQRVCGRHGGDSPQALAAADRRLEEEAKQVALREGLAAAYGDDVPDVDAADAMLQAVSWKYAEVLALRAKVAELEDEDRVWGVTKTKDGGDDAGTTKEAKPNIWWVMLHKAEEQLVFFAKSARAAGCDERRVQLAEQEGQLLAGVIGRILSRIFDALVVRLGEHEAARVLVESVWSELVVEIVPSELRALAAGVDHEAAS